MGRDLRRLKNVKRVLDAVTSQESFDELFALVFHHDRSLVMRAADAVEKITVKNKHYLEPHKAQLLAILKSADHKELKWHIAQLLPRLALTKEEVERVWHQLTYWTLNRNESKIVRVNALQGLFDISKSHGNLQRDFIQTLSAVEHERIPSLQVRVRKIRHQMSAE